MLFRSAHVRIGGWGSELADLGSGFYIGKQAIIAVLDSEDGRRTGSDRLKEKLLESLGLNSVEQIVPWYYEVRKTPFWRAKIADLAVAVVRLAEMESDFQAMDILEKAAEEMQTSLLAAISRAHEQGVITKTGVQPMIIEGGVARNSKYIQNRIFGLLKARRLGEWDVKVSTFHPVVGAVAFALSGQTTLPSSNVLAKLQESAQKIGVVL